MILIVDDDIAIRTSLTFLLSQNGYEAFAVETPEESIQYLRSNNPQLILLDLNFTIETSGKEGIELLQRVRVLHPNTPIILITAWGSIELAVEGMKHGANDFITKPWDNKELLKRIDTLIQLQVKTKGTETELRSRFQLNSNYDFDKIIGEHPKLISILQSISRVAKTDAPVLITGESGTGKELIAEAIHNNSDRKNQPFVKVNLGGIPNTLFESEMFGHKKGAFTDAHSDRIGRFEMANKGTIFLDEIGELDLASQVKLLRVLQEKTYESLGDSKTKLADVRIICATNKDLRKQIDKELFREDLYYRINLMEIKMPALRERNSDIPLLANYFIKKLKKSYGLDNISITKEAIQWLKKQNYPGNIRELKNLVERTTLMSGKTNLELEDFSKLESSHSNAATDSAIEIKRIIPLDETEKIMIKNAIEFYNGNMSKVAETLGLSRGALYRRLEKHGIDHNED